VETFKKVSLFLVVGIACCRCYVAMTGSVSIATPAEKAARLLACLRIAASSLGPGPVGDKLLWRGGLLTHLFSHWLHLIHSWLLGIVKLSLKCPKCQEAHGFV
jgi:hypothetical protein